MIFFRKSRITDICLTVLGVMVASTLTIIPAFANDLYVTLEGGAGWTSDSDIDGTGIDTSAEFEVGPVIGL